MSNNKHERKKHNGMKHVKEEKEIENNEENILDDEDDIQDEIKSHIKDMLKEDEKVNLENNDDTMIFEMDKNSEQDDLTDENINYVTNDNTIIADNIVKNSDEEGPVKDLKKDKKKNKKQKKHKKLRLFLKIMFLLILVLIVVGVAAVVAIFKTDKWAITEKDLLTDAGATLYDRYGNEIVTLTGDEINKKIEYNEMGKLPDAFVAIEDERFFDHHGIDIKRTLHAILDFVIHRGNGSFGGSTITQQLIKITMKDDERSGFAGIERKIREWSRAVQVEKILNKEQILERYLNRIYLGQSNGLEVRGVEAASNYYFNKSAKDLSIAESAFIAGINHSPNSYNPFGETDISESIKTRTLNVLAKMHELGKINDEEYNTATEETKNGLQFNQGSASNGNSNLSFHASAAINQIAKELSDEKDIDYNEAREMVVSSGYKIYTTVDNTIQNSLETEFKNAKYIKQGTSDVDSRVHEPGQSAMVVIDPSNGFVVGEVGSLEAEPNTLGLNRGLSTRQPGSSFKPLATIGPGLENKVINASTLFYDTPTSFGNYKPRNDSNSYGGITTIRNAIVHSYNVTEVKLLSIMGLQKSQEFLAKVGIDVDANEAGLSLALGSKSVTPVQMAAGFAMIANKGVYITPTFYTKVEDQDGNTVIEAKQEKTRVMSEENAYIETSILQGPISAQGTAPTFVGYLGNMDVAGKTGTSDSAVDRWFCGFTPYYAAACWYGADDGYNYNGTGGRMSFWGTNPAASIWFPVMKSIQTRLNLEAKKFEQPSSIETLKICRVTGKKATDNCKDTFSEIFTKDNEPEECNGHQTVTICKETNKIATEFCKETEEKSFGTVIDTEKNANWSPAQKAGEAPTETCDVHTKAEEIDVPNVVGKDEKIAMTLLENSGFKVKVLKDNDKNKAKGVVLKQSSTKAPKGSEITITVNQYNGAVTSGNTTGGTTATNTTNTNSTGNGTVNKPTTNSTTTNAVVK